ncbi:GxxExxY protein [Methanococcoides sp. SA1]|nr:GxxExxY protein [Methanococcoides sp. SA1]
MELNEITQKIIGCAIKVHKTLGPGFLKSVYLAALAYEMDNVGLQFEKEKSLSVPYEDIILDVGFHCDFFVENRVIVETKAVKEITKIDQAQLLNYLKIKDLKVGLLINFNCLKLTDGIKRMVNNFYLNSASSPSSAVKKI